jgi:hypothetical protein
LKEEFVQATAGFKKVLQQRTDGMKETTDRKRQVYGGSSKDQDYNSMVNLENKPLVYESSMGQAGFPTLDLTSGMSAGEPTGSGSQLPRPRKYSLLWCLRACYGGWRIRNVRISCIFVLFAMHIYVCIYVC